MRNIRWDPNDATRRHDDGLLADADNQLALRYDPGFLDGMSMKWDARAHIHFRLGDEHRVEAVFTANQIT